MLTPEQQQLYSQSLNQLGPQFIGGFEQFLGPTNQQDLQNVFQKSYVDPAMQAYQQNILPSIQERFVDLNAGSSSALNQALAQSATDLSTALGSQYGNLYQNDLNRQLQSLNMFSPFLTNQTFVPRFEEKQGLLGPGIGAAGQLAAAGLMAGAMSSRKVKENISDYDKGLELVKNMKVKKYDYKKEVGGMKDRVGLIAEDLPKELTIEKDNILHVDLYSLVSLLVNSIKELNEKVEKLEGKR